MRKLLWFTLGFSGACLLTVYLLPELWLGWAGLAGGLLLPGLGLVWRRAKGHRTSLSRRRLLWAGFGLGLGLLWCLGYETLVLSPARQALGAQPSLQAELCDWPQESSYGHRVDVLAQLPGGQVRTRLYIYGPMPELEPGDRILGSFTLRRADRDADGEAYLDLQAKGILLTGSGQLQAIQPGGRPLRWLPQRLARALFLRLGELVPADGAGLLQAMLTGDRSGLSRARRQELSYAGVSHIIAVSGLHVTMLLGILLFFTGRGRRAALLGIPMLALYALITGASPSVIRAAVMLSLLLLAPLLRAERDSPTALSAAALLLLGQNPWAIANLSFQLSFGAVAGLLLLASPLQSWLLQRRLFRRALRWKGPKVLPDSLRRLSVRLLRAVLRGLCGSASASLSALVFTLPITAGIFGYLPVYSVLANLPVLPLAALCLAGALAVLALGAVSTALGAWAGQLLAWPVRLLLGIARLISRLPGSLLWLDGYGIAFLVFAYGLGLLVLLQRKRPLGWTLLSLATALAAAVLLQGLEARACRSVLAALDVGQGQCVCILRPDFAALVDCGSSSGDWPGTQAAAYLRRWGRTRLDALVLTHYDTDHVSGVAALLEQIPVDVLYLPRVDFDPANRARVEAAARVSGASLCYVESDLELSFEGGSLALYAPVSLENDNAACVSVLYSAEEYDMLVTGDLDAQGEALLLERHSLPRVELYIAGHHGSKTASSETLLRAIAPETVFISVGRNSYGLPSPQILEQLEAAGAEVYRTDQCGNLEVLGR